MCHATPRLPDTTYCAVCSSADAREYSWLRPDRRFPCPGFAPTVGFAMCCNKFLARLPQLMNNKQLAMNRIDWTFGFLGYVRCAKTINHRVNDPTKRTIMLNCLFLIWSQNSQQFVPRRSTGFEAIKFWSRHLAPRSTSRQVSSHT